MKISDAKKRRFLDMQQHPERYSDEQIEAMMAEIDEPVDVNTEWDRFYGKTEAAEKPQRITIFKRIYRWQNIVAMLLMALGIWGATQYVKDKEIAIVTENAIPESTNNSAARKRSDSVAKNENKGTEYQKEKEAVNNEQLIALNAKTDEVKESQNYGFAAPATSAGKLRIRGYGANMDLVEDELLIVVNGKKILSELRILINRDDIESTKLWRDGEKVAHYEALYGSQARNGVIEIFLKEGRELAYADFWATKDGSEDVFAYAAETYPKFPGGEQALTQFFRENTKYPMEAPDSAINGRVMIRFTVKEDGHLEDFEVLRSMLKKQDGTACNDSAVISIFAAEALRVCRLMPSWEPGGRIIEGKYQSVPLKCVVPVSFAEKKGIRVR